MPSVCPLGYSTITVLGGKFRLISWQHCHSHWYKTRLFSLGWSSGRLSHHCLLEAVAIGFRQACMKSGSVLPKGRSTRRLLSPCREREERHTWRGDGVFLAWWAPGFWNTDFTPRWEKVKDNGRLSSIAFVFLLKKGALGKIFRFVWVRPNTSEVHLIAPQCLLHKEAEIHATLTSGKNRLKLHSVCPV